MNTKNPVDYKWIGMIIIFCLIVSAVGYVFTYLISISNNLEKVKNFDCNTLTKEQWYNNTSGREFRTLDEYKQFCVKDKQVILNQPYVFGIVSIVIIPIMIGLIVGKTFGIHKDAEDGLIK